MSRVVALSPEQQSGKAAFKALVKAFGGQEAAAIESGVRRQKISDMGLANVPEFPTLDLIDSLEDRTVGLPGWPHVTSWLCKQRGGVFVRLPDVDGDGGSIVSGVVELAGELGDVSDAVRDAVHVASDMGAKISPAEAAEIDSKLEELIATAVAMRMSLEPLAARTPAGGRAAGKDRRGK
jgi:hypothetical protein